MRHVHELGLSALDTGLEGGLAAASALSVTTRRQGKHFLTPACIPSRDEQLITYQGSPGFLVC